MTHYEKGLRAYALLLLALLAVALLMGCEPLRKGENRKITAWGIWAAPFGTPVGIGYWHSERGPGVESEQSAKPPEWKLNQ